MSKRDIAPAVDLAQGVENPAEPYTVYAAGGIFTQHELATNVFLKEAVWRSSNGKYQMVLPQSKELRELDRPDIATYIRNADLFQVVIADIFMARFDGLELDAGTVIEFMMAKMLGKPAVILRCDSRRLSSDSLDEPYNLMVKNWPRTVEVHVDSLIGYISSFAGAREALGEGATFQDTVKAELDTVRKGIEAIAEQIVGGLEAVVKMKSPYPPEYQEMVYQALRYSPGGGFGKLLAEEELAGVVQRLRKKGVL